MERIDKYKIQGGMFPNEVASSYLGFWQPFWILNIFIIKGQGKIMYWFLLSCFNYLYYIFQVFKYVFLKCQSPTIEK